MTKNYVCRAPYLKNHTSYDFHLWYTCVKYGQFFHFFKILIFWIVRGVKGQKTVQNDKKLCLSGSISQEPYIIWSSFVVCKCKLIISSGVFFIFSKLWFFRLLVGSKAKKWTKMTKNFVCRAIYLRNHTSYDLYLWYICGIG